MHWGLMLTRLKVGWLVGCFWVVLKVRSTSILASHLDHFLSRADSSPLKELELAGVNLYISIHTDAYCVSAMQICDPYAYCIKCVFIGAYVCCISPRERLCLTLRYGILLKYYLFIYLKCKELTITD